MSIEKKQLSFEEIEAQTATPVRNEADPPHM
jgi:hypothetical protein